MNLSFGQSPWLLVLLLLVAVGASWWTYQTTIPEIRPLLRWFLGGLRAVALAIILFLLFEPVLERTTTENQEPTVAILVDDSESMALSDSLAGANGQQLNEQLQRLNASLKGLKPRFFAFGSSLRSLDSLESVSYSQGRTDISGALEALTSQLQNESLKAILLLSDGLYNTGTNPLHSAERSPVPIFTIAHGDSSAQRDVRIVQVISNELTFANTIVPVLVRIRNDGYPSQNLNVRLFSGAQTLSQKVVPLPASGTEVEVELSFEAVKVGRNNLTVSVSSFQDEVTNRNNAQSLSILVLDQKKNILVLGGAPSPDVSAFARALKQDETAQVELRTQAPNGSFYEGDLPSDLSELDLIVSIGFPGRATSPATSASIASVVSGGVPLLFVLDRGTDLNAVQRDFNTLLPASLKTPRQSFITGSMALAPLADSHAIFDTGERSDNATWNRLPPLTLTESRWESIASSTVLATSVIRGVALGDPLFVVARVGQTKSAAFLAHGFWQWTNVPEDLEPESATFKAVLENTIQWLYATDDNRLVRVEPSEQEYAEGEIVVLKGEVYDETLRPVSDAALSVQMTSPDGQVFPYEMSSVGNGRYSLDVGSLPAGSYEYTATAARNELILGEDTGFFSIGTRTLEFRNTKADFALMAQIAARSGGAVIAPEDVTNVLNQLESIVDLSSTSRLVNAQSRLWQKVPFLFLIMVLLTAEWFFRKRFGMV